MARKNFFDDFFELLLSIGLFYLIYKLVHGEDLSQSEQKQLPGISGLPGRIRFFRAYREEEKEPYREELLKLDHELITKAIGLANRANTSPELKGTWIKHFQGDIISGELRSGQIRILFYRIDELNYILLTIFLKKDEETDRLYKEKARRRIANFNSGTKR